ncbi:CD3337/EF1877 family mobilome membrane protein [Paramaledivibacter caminithermalis]|uniref:Uncharacterized protein n=1 Tax=Paramaledivibacter caminithermalis (strain DSM 15212 / CIP 107654 / DViRD3) TaxID=1121301 RepID=A0A1M6SRV4_PARC5|nr:hypothetical protein [Paramaledivibacter caminithermalis]SHK47370.1 hypothetical protein SAMN02745912_03410 [Paramaledivibacter caminithermalis DSM 15212]
MKKKMSFFFIILIIFSFMPISFADEKINEDPVDEIFDVLKNHYSNIDDLEKKITKYKSANYYLDIKEYSSLFNPIKKLVSNVNSINNLLFGLNKMISKITIFILLFAYEFDLYEFLSEYIDLIMNALRVPVYDKNILTIIAFIGLYSIIVVTFGDRKTTVLNNAIRAIIITLIAMIFLNSPSTYLTKINDFSKVVSNEIFESTYGRYENIKNNSNTKVNSDRALVSAGAMIWDITVHKPWQALVLGKTTDKKLTEEILQYDPYDNKRIDKIKKMSDKNSLLRLSGIFPRFGALLLFMIFNAVLAVIISMVSGVSIMAQAMVVTLSFGAPFILILALIPKFTNVLGAWGLKISGYSCIKIAITFFLSILLVVCGAIYSSIDKNGIIITLVIMAIVAFTIYHSRHKFVDIIKSIPRGERAVRREIKTPSQAMEKIKDYRSIVTGYSKEKITDAVATVTSAITKSSSESYKGIYDRRTQERYRNMANEYLERKYNEDSEKAELRASRLGRDDVEYPSFVKDADMRVKLGQSKFTESQINSVIKVIRKIEMEGEDPYKFINGEAQGIGNREETINKSLNAKNHAAKLSNKEIYDRMGVLESQIRNRRENIEKSYDLSEEERNKELLEIYRLWQQKFEYMNIIQDRKIDKNKKSFSRFNEYKELKVVRNEVNKEIKEMANIFNDDFKGDKIAAFDKKLNVQVKLRRREDELIKALEGRSELTDIREKALGKEASILSKFGIDRIKNRDMLLYEDEEYTKGLEELKGLYNLEESKVKELNERGISVRNVNEELRRELKVKAPDDVESLLLARADMNIYDTKDLTKFEANDKKNDTYIENKPDIHGISSKTPKKEQVNNNHDNDVDRSSRKTSIKARPSHSKVDIDKLIHRDDEILHELRKDSHKSQSIHFKGEHIEKLGEEIAKNIDTSSNDQGTSSNTIQNIKQDIVIQNARELNSQFSKDFNLRNNQIFFESLIKKYGNEAVRAELSGMKEMKNKNNIENPKGLLIARLKYNHKPREN